jgi:hypothetical protein
VHSGFARTVTLRGSSVTGGLKYKNNLVMLSITPVIPVLGMWRKEDGTFEVTMGWLHTDTLS